MPGSITPATIGWNHLSSACRPRKYQGAFEGLGVWLKLASSRSGAFTNTEKIKRNAVQASAATNSMTSRCGQTWTLSCGVAFTSWIEPDLTTVSRRWVCPPGPVASGAAAAAAAATTPPPPAGGDTAEDETAQPPAALGFDR